MQAALNVVLFSGSLRKFSTNSGVIRYILSLAASFPNVNFEVQCLNDLPMYNGDIDPTETRVLSPKVTDWPAAVKTLRCKVEKADLLIFAISEHNANVSPVLINMISWASRPEKVQRNGQEVTIAPIVGKKVAVVSAAGGVGGVNAQTKLRDMAYLKLEFLDLPAGPLYLSVSKPGFFDGNGDVVDEDVKKNVRALVESAINVLKKN